MHFALLPALKVIRRASPWQYLGDAAPIRTLRLVLLRDICERHGGTDDEVSLGPCLYAGCDTHVKVLAYLKWFS